MNGQYWYEMMTTMVMKMTNIFEINNDENSNNEIEKQNSNKYNGKWVII